MTVLGPLIREGFALAPTYTGNVLRIVFTGCADTEAQSLLGDYFRLVHAEVTRARVTEVVVDIHGLFFINSSCFKAFVTWVALLNEADQSLRYRIRFLKDPNLRWQARSFDALHRMSLAPVTIEDWVRGTK